MLEILNTDFKISKWQWHISFIFSLDIKFYESKHNVYQKAGK